MKTIVKRKRLKNLKFWFSADQEKKFELKIFLDVDFNFDVDGIGKYIKKTYSNSMFDPTFFDVGYYLESTIAFSTFAEVKKFIKEFFDESRRIEAAYAAAYLEYEKMEKKVEKELKKFVKIEN